VLNGKVSRIIQGNKAQVLCDATVDLISKVQRPWLFKVTVTGLPPHAYTRTYEIAARNDDTAAMTGIRQFVKEMESPSLAIFQQPSIRIFS
jgi:predicted DCC family thiol-disulfide oxidoreductase YuxK